jgi:tetraacyldisaccharide 4'-kinase
MNPLSAIFGSAVALRNALYDRGVFKVRRLLRPVVSIGNLSVGGSGKTPFVIALGQMLKERGIEFDILSRGYGRRTAGVMVVDPAGSAAQFGDEPLLMARRLHVPVIVGADRYQAGLLAEKTFSSKLHLLDDGFQHRRLHRDFDIVMLPKSDLDAALLPEGRLREPLSSLKRADAVVTSRDEDEVADDHDSGNSLKTVERVMHAEERPTPPQLMVLSAEIWHMKRSIYLEETPARPLVFCGIARPGQFFTGLSELGIEAVKTVSFPDHHRYTEADIRRLLALKSSTKSGGFITTEKDLVNLGALAERLQPLQVGHLRILLAYPEGALGTLLSALEKRWGSRF